MTSSDTVPVTDSLAPAVVSEFFAEAATAVDTLALHVSRTGELFRRAEIRTANEALVQIPGELRNFIVMVDVVSGQLRAESAALTVDGLSAPDQLVRLRTWFEALVEAQANDDALTIADILEYDLKPYLKAWSAILVAQASGAAHE